jgi:hypothetical protein
MEPVDHLLVGGVEDLEGGHDLPGGHGLHLHLAAADLVHALGEHAEVVLRGYAGRPGGLHLEDLGRGLLAKRRGGREGGACERGKGYCMELHGVPPIGMR